MLYIFDNERKPVKCRALLDTCSTANFISESVVDRLKLPIKKCVSSIDAIGSTVTESRGVVRITIQAIRGSFRRNLTCLVLSTISDLIPAEPFPRKSIVIPTNIQLADPEFHMPGNVDLLIGSGITLSLFSIGQINLTRGECDLYIQKTRLGWVVAGGTSPSNTSRDHCYLSRLESQLARLWEIEEFPLSKPRSTEEANCESHFKRHTMRNNDGRYTVRLPFRGLELCPGESRTVAYKRLITLERKFESNAALKSE